MFHVSGFRVQGSAPFYTKLGYKTVATWESNVKGDNEELVYDILKRYRNSEKEMYR
jgi:predicted N-acetyltransferase YhbS